MSEAVTAIRLTDKPLLKDLERIMKARGDGNPTKTARELLLERISELRLKGDPRAQEPQQTAAA